MTRRAWQASDSVIPTDWAQQAIYGGPVIAPTIEALIGRISLFTVHGATALHLWDSRDGLDLARVIDVLGLPPDARYSAAVTPASRTPVETGYLECLHLSHDPGGSGAAEAVSTFMSEQRGRYPDIEAHLTQCYRELSAERAVDRRFRGIDYDAFDLGPMRLGFGLFAHHARHERMDIWCWSRVVNWHK